MMANNKKIIEHGTKHPEDKDLHWTTKGSANQIGADGKVINKKTKTIKFVRDRIIDPSIPKGQKGHITYTKWKETK